MQALDGYHNFRIMEKDKSSPFSDWNYSSGAFIKQLKGWNVSEINLVGANGDWCVDKTIRDALSESYKVRVYNPGVISFNTVPFEHPYVYNGKLNSHFGDTPDLTNFRETSDINELFKTSPMKKTIIDDSIEVTD